MTGIDTFSTLTSSYNLDNSTSTTNIFVYSMNQSANNISEWINGTANTITGSYTLPANMDQANSYNTIYIGTRGDGVTGRFTGTISEILIYNTTPTTIQRQEIESYLASKWGITYNQYIYPPKIACFITAIQNQTGVSTTTTIRQAGITNLIVGQYNSSPGYEAVPLLLGGNRPVKIKPLNTKATSFKIVKKKRTSGKTAVKRR